MRRLLLAIALAGLAGCHTSTTPATEEVVSRPLVIELRDSRGDEVSLEDVRGRPVLLALLGTYDTVSQASLDPLRRLARNDPELVVLVLLAQVGAGEVVDAYATAAGVPFPVVWDPSGRLLRGETELGHIAEVPTVVALNTLGVPVASRSGIITDAVLGALVAHARAHSPDVPPSPPPLMGRSHGAAR